MNLSIVVGIVLTLAVFFLVVVVHELGHFLTARMTGMKVLEFGFGIPPKMIRLFRDKKGTDFTLNWLPIGGFVRIFGEDPRSPEAFAPGAFMSKSLPKRLLVLVAGVVMNFFLAWVIFTGIFLTGARPLAPLPLDIGPTHSYFMPSFTESLSSGFVTHSGIEITPLSGSVAERAGIS